MFKKELIHIYSGLFVFSLFFLFCISQSVATTENLVESENISPAETAIEGSDEAVDEWEYVFENRPDPFLPFIELKVATKNIPDTDDVILTGMQLFEPGQLTLVAIMYSSKNKVAMVEDVTGKGYVLNEGMLIGRYGVVNHINTNQVNITETREVAGKDVVTPVVMRLNKEGDS